MTAATAAPGPAGPPRQALVVATQCARERKLTGLAPVAAALFDALTDPRTGGCEPSGADGTDEVRSGAATRQLIDETVRAAIKCAGEAGAVLVLVFIGHGQAPADATTLHYMANDSAPGEAGGSVDVGALLAAAADQPGIGGVVALVDTCHAAAGAPPAANLAGGYAQGLKRVTVLAATAAHRPAYSLDFSRALTSVLREGVPDAGEFLLPRHAKRVLGGKLSNQNVMINDFDGDPDAVDELWLAHNACHLPAGGRPGGCLGETGGADLADALAAWPGAPLPPPGGWTRAELVALTARAIGSPAPEALWVREVAGALVAAVDTAAFLTGWASGLTTARLRDAVTLVNRLSATSGPAHPPLRPPAGLTGGELLRHLLEYAALRTAPASAGGTGGGLARCVAAVADVCGLDCSDGPAREWARRTDAVIALADARDGIAELRARREPRLVISLHAARVDWPESLSVWLREGDRCDHRQEFGCEPTRAGVEEMLPEILDWAEALLPPGAPVRHVDIVAPSSVLLSWQPERARAGLYELGVDRTVTLRWAHRLSVPGRLGRMNRVAREQLRALAEPAPGGRAPVDWLDADAAGDLAALGEFLRIGRYQRAIGVDHRPPHLAEVADALLPYTPILLWPGAEDGRAGTEQRRSLDELWSRLPAGFGDAYRRRRHADAGLAPAPGTDDGPLLDALAELRAVWHDLEWLDFCQWFETARSPAPSPAPAHPSPRGTR
ncbi:vWA-MoxR associated conflict system protein [Streptomyces sp. NPDC001985]|uniref:vWA-MoxR associated conflict system protein n=1 Tax=Streptomyces sp. NPDC001985 TaxID=3154406 RepID=UPI003332F8BC